MNEMIFEYVTLSLLDEGDAGFGILVKFASGEDLVLHSVCVHREDAERICEVVNRIGVSECQVRDVIEDLLP